MVEGMEHQRCLWHGWKDLGYMLWAERMSKDERNTIAGQLKKLAIALPFEEKVVMKEYKEEIGKRLNRVKISITEMVDYLKSKGYHRASGYLERASRNLFTYVKLWLEKGVQVGKTTDTMERTVREIARRVKRIGASWGDTDLLAILRFLLKRYFEKEGYMRYWSQFYNPGLCEASLIVAKP